MVEEMKSTSCPIEQFGNILSILNSLGLLPYKSLVRNSDQIKKDSSSVLIKCRARYILLNIVLPEALSMTALLIYLFARPAWMEYFSNLHREESVTSFTLTAVFAYQTIIIQANVVGAVIMVMKVDKMAILNDNIKATLPKLLQPAKDPRKSLFKHIFSKVITLMTYLFFTGLWHLIMILRAGDNPLIHIYMIVMYTTAYLPPCSMMNEVNAKVHLDFIDSHFKSLKEALEITYGQSAIHYGLDIAKNLKSATETLGLLILWQCGISFMNEVIFIYFAFLSYGMISSASATMMAYAVAVVIINIHNTGQKINLFHMGQRIKNHMSECLNVLQERRMKEHFKTVPAYKLDLLEKVLEDKEPIRPCDAFALNYDALCSSYGLLLTFAIVLIQFNVTAK